MTKRTSQCKIAGCVLAGGEARRMGGAAKGALPAAAGVSIAERLVAQLESAGVAEVVIAANEPAPYAHCGRRIIADLRPRIGPLGGIEAALAYFGARFDATVFLPCDVPGITASEISTLKAASADAPVVFAASGKNFWHPLCAVVHNDSLEDISAAIDAGERSVRAVWKRLGAQAVHFKDEAAFANINTPEDFETWRRRSEDCGP